MKKVSVAEILRAHADRSPAVDAIRAVGGGLTYETFFGRVAATSHWLITNGLRPEAVTGISIHDETDHLVVSLALLAMATPQVILPEHETEANRQSVGATTGVAQVVADCLQPWNQTLPVLLPPLAVRRGLAPVGTAEPDWRAADEDAVAFFQTTSGSTGVPKIFGLSYERLLRVARNILTEPTQLRVLRTSTVEYSASRFYRIAALLAGTTGVFLPVIEPSTFGGFCAANGVTEVHMGPYKLASLAAAASASRLPAGTRIMTGGARIPGPLRRRVAERLTSNLWITYATSEVGLISTASPDQHEAFPEGVGFTDGQIELAIVDRSGDPVEPGTPGLVRVRKKGLPTGYVGEAASSDRFRDGWFQPGDLVSLRPGEPIIFHGRADDMMILNGVNIFASAIEDTLALHPDVAEVIAYPIRSNIHGDIPVAAIVLSATATNHDPATFVAFCRKAIGFHAPRKVFILDRLPRTPLGKPSRAELPR